jgi:hypothetical protein
MNGSLIGAWFKIKFSGKVYHYWLGANGYQRQVLKI